MFKFDHDEKTKYAIYTEVKQYHIMDGAKPRAYLQRYFMIIFYHNFEKQFSTNWAMIVVAFQ